MILASGRVVIIVRSHWTLTSLEVEPTRAFAGGRDGDVRESERSRGAGKAHWP